METKALFARLKAKYHVFHLKKPYHSAAAETKIRQQWTEYLGADRILELEEAKACVDVMVRPSVHQLSTHPSVHPPVHLYQSPCPHPSSRLLWKS
jgi:hypothetical protein